MVNRNRGFALRLTCAVVSERHYTFRGTETHQAAGNLAGPQPSMHDADIFAKVPLRLSCSPEGTIKNCLHII